MTLIQVLIDTPIILQGWYTLLIPCYLTVILFPRSRLCDVLFSSGLIFLPAVIYLVAFAVVGGISSLFGNRFFADLLSTSEFGHIQVASAFKVTATAADLAFAVIVFRKYPDLSILVKLLIGFWMLMVGWLLGVAFYFLLRKVKGVSDVPVRLGPFVIA